jgi:hypothetical protein
MKEANVTGLKQIPPLSQSYKRKYDELVLTVPWISQLGDKADDPNDCGAACVLMLLRAVGKVDDTLTVEGINEVMFPNIVGMTSDQRKTWLKEHGDTGASQLVALGGKYKLTLESNKVDSKLNRIYQALDEERAVILGIDYAGLYKSAKWDEHLLGPEEGGKGKDQGGHWLLVIGYRDADFVVHDPLWLNPKTDGTGGKKWNLTYQQVLDAAIWDAGDEDMVY